MCTAKRILTCLSPKLRCSPYPRIAPHPAMVCPWEALRWKIKANVSTSSCEKTADSDLGANLVCAGMWTAPVSRSTSTNRVISTAGRFRQLHMRSQHDVLGEGSWSASHSENPRDGKTMHLCTAPIGAFGVASVLNYFCKATLFAGRLAVWVVGHDAGRGQSQGKANNQVLSSYSGS